MSSCENKLPCILNEDIGKLILRVSIAGLMLFHGFFKLFNGIDGIKFLVTQAGLPEFFAYGVYLGEIIFPILIIIGLFTRISSIFFALTMVFAIFLAFSIFAVLSIEKSRNFFQGAKRCLLAPCPFRAIFS